MWRDGAGGIETALVHRPRYDDWSFPKGKALPGEHVLLTAVREVAEETGARVALGRRLAGTQYLTSGGPKRVDYWAGRPVSPGTFIPGDEVDALSWLPWPPRLISSATPTMWRYWRGSPPGRPTPPR